MANSSENLQVIVPYCERLASGGEPINTLSNACFILVALYGCMLLRSQRDVSFCSNTADRIPHPSIQPLTSAAGHAIGAKPRWLALYCLVILPLVIAAGSALFHATPGPVTHLLDIVPVCLFALLTFWLTLERYQWPYRKTIILLALWIAATAIAAAWPEVLAHSLFYLPTLVILIYLAITLKQQRPRLKLLAITFGGALLFRAIDLPLCIPGSDAASAAFAYTENSLGLAGNVGTHFLWHVLTAIACILCLQLVLATRTRH